MVTPFFPLAGQLPDNWKNNCNLLSACVWIEKWAHRPKYSKKIPTQQQTVPSKVLLCLPKSFLMCLHFKSYYWAWRQFPERRVLLRGAHLEENNQTKIEIKLLFKPRWEGKIVEEVQWDQTVMRLDISLRRNKLIITGGGFIPFIFLGCALLQHENTVHQ